ncbi:hypothetical protein [Arthrobacter sp. L77]|uniref:hypothetical protein n=1 Tax=Arthrobacter sp. L77 TaxID=1496689 RepID=UPI0005B9A283|nr:hypothetical protein [Arthrobacter sp. L77]
MSTPQDTPNGQDNGPAWNAPGAGGTGRNPSSQQAPSPNYAYPASGAPGLAEKGPAPKEVQRAYYLILAAGVLHFLSSVVGVTEIPEGAGSSVQMVSQLLFAALAAAVYVVLAIFIRRGRNWARITATVLAALNVLVTVGGLLLLPLANQAVEASGQEAVPVSGLSITLSVIVLLLGVAGVVLTYLKPARPYFAPQKLGY